MGKVRMGILDGFKGKVGTVVGSFWKGKKVMRAYNEFPSNPRTSAQLIQRQKFALIASLGGVFSDFLKMTLRGYANGEQNSIIGQFVGQNINSVTVSGSTVEVDYETLSLTPPKSPLTAVALGETDFSTPLTVSVPVDDNYLDPEKNSANDKLYLVVLAKANDYSEADAVYSDGTAKRTSETVSLRVPGFWQGRFVEVYAVLTADPLSQRAGECSKTLYCGSGRIA